MKYWNEIVEYLILAVNFTSEILEEYLILDRNKFNTNEINLKYWSI